MNVDILEARLRKENNLPESFAFFRWECFPQDGGECMYVTLTGAECPLLKTGKRKGKPNYSKGINKRSFNVSVDKAEQWDADYERETGNCRRCLGTCKTVSRVSVADGVEYRTCETCQGTGKAKAIPETIQV